MSSSSSAAPPPPGSAEDVDQEDAGSRTTRSIAGGKSFKRKFAAVNKRLLEGTITAEEAVAIKAFEGKFEVDPTTNQLVRTSQLIPVTPSGLPVYPPHVPLEAAATSASSSPYTGPAFVPRRVTFDPTIPEDRIIPRVPRITVPSESPEIVQDRLAPQAGATPKGTKAPKLAATPKAAPKLATQRTLLPSSTRGSSRLVDSLAPSPSPRRASATAGG